MPHRTWKSHQSNPRNRRIPAFRTIGEIGGNAGRFVSFGVTYAGRPQSGHTGPSTGWSQTKQYRTTASIRRAAGRVPCGAS